jgi:excisionase family DNA binding protein
VGEVENAILSRLDRLTARIDELLKVVVAQRAVKEKYTVAEVAEVLGRTPFTVREWARLGRIRAVKRACGRGRSQEWMISHEELTRIRDEGLLPLSSFETKDPH